MSYLIFFMRSMFHCLLAHKIAWEIIKSRTATFYKNGAFYNSILDTDIINSMQPKLVSVGSFNWDANQQL